MTENKQDLLVEIGTEELPPKALPALSAALEELLCARLRDHDLEFGACHRFATPRRLAVLITDLDTEQQDKESTRYGPAVKAAFDAQGEPTRAALGFASSCGIAVTDLTQEEKDGVEKLCHHSVVKGQPTSALLAEAIQESLAQLPVPKRMRWGSSREEFVRPVHWLVVLFGDSVVPVRAYGVDSGSDTFGHRFMHNHAISLESPGEYEKKLQDPGQVIADFGKRRELIREQVNTEANKLGARAQIDDDLLDEVTALVEYPVALTGNFEEQFLEVPAEAVILAMKSHQKCFNLTGADGELLPRFIAISNIVSRDPAQVIEGNERVIRPRLADARFFFETDKQTPLAARIEALDRLKFQDKLGSVYDKTRRVARLAKWMAESLDGNAVWCERAASLSKCDLLTQMVGEFADLQGLMGYYYALHDGEPEEVAVALNEQYQPRHAGAPVPETLTGAILALADRIDTMVGLFGIGQPPTGSRDPFGLRRSAIGVLRILVKKSLDLDAWAAIQQAASGYENVSLVAGCEQQVFDFLLDRFRAWYADEGIGASIFQSVLAVRPVRPLDFHRRVQAVHHFTTLSEAGALAAANKRVSNILDKQSEQLPNDIDESLLAEAEEKTLYRDLRAKESEVAPMFAAGNYTEGLQALAQLKDSVDSFFDQVLVMSEDSALRTNRLALLQHLRNLFLQTADISHLHNT
ncbi:MAG: glycine--tRNA ligase subunit beta [Pseudohongiellaceae bacterium]